MRREAIPNAEESARAALAGALTSAGVRSLLPPHVTVPARHVPVAQLPMRGVVPGCCVQGLWLGIRGYAGRNVGPTVP